MNSGLVAEIAQLVECWLPKPKVAGSSPVFRSDNIRTASMYVCFTSSGSFLFLSPVCVDPRFG